MSVPTYVFGLGNVLMGDDGWGPVVVDAFESEYVVGTDVEVVDLGTPGLDLLPWLADVEQVILVDTVKADAPPGTIRIYDKEQVLRHPPPARTGPHDPGVKSALLALEFAGRQPRDLTLVGVVPHDLRPGLQLSEAVARAIPAAITAIADQLRRWNRRVEHIDAAPSARRLVHDSFARLR